MLNPWGQLILPQTCPTSCLGGGGTWEGWQEVPEAASPSPAQTAEPLGLWMLQTDPQTDRQSDTWPGHGAQWGTVSAADATVAAVDQPPARGGPGAHQLCAPALKCHPGRDSHPVHLHPGAAARPVQSPQHLRLRCHLAGGGPRQRVKFLVMSDRGPVAETQWSSETRLQQAQALQAAPGPQSAGTVVITAVLSILLALVLTALLALLVYTCYDTCQSTPISGPGEPVGVRRYNTHHMFSPPAVGGS
ncbi:uncharacterized protein [Equus przewalskii]|uniref:Uncharacterized protein isoform X3 n=1 Tax=Equus przewalskii TaxID=9798 RepID=A0ABM4K2S0_EQUPR